MSGDVVVQLVEWNGIDDVVIVILYSSAFPITITILLKGAEVLQGDGLRTSIITFLSQLI